MRPIFAAVALLLVVGLFSGALLATSMAAVSPGIHYGAVGTLDNKCTVFAIRPTLLVTASHCVGGLGETERVAYRVGHKWQWHDATIVFDSYRATWKSDVALLVPEMPWPATLTLWGSVPIFPAVCQILSNPRGIVQIMSGTCEARGLYEKDDKYVLVFFATFVGPGSSGGPLFIDNRVAGMVTGGDLETHIEWATPAGDIWRALREWDASR